MSVRISVIAGVAMTSSNAFVTISSANAFASMFSFVRALALFSGGASPMADVAVALADKVPDFDRTSFLTLPWCPPFSDCPWSIRLW